MKIRWMKNWAFAIFAVFGLALGHLRESAVADFLVADGIDGLGIKKDLRGNEKPLFKGSNEEAWSKNRRIEINGE